MNTLITTLITTLVLAAIISTTGAAAAPVRAEEASDDAWHHSLLFAPTARQIEVEQRGRIVIYDGLRDVDVERAMDPVSGTQFPQFRGQYT